MDLPNDDYRFVATRDIYACTRCGALVVEDSIDDHDRWHTEQGG